MCRHPHRPFHRGRQGRTAVVDGCLCVAGFILFHLFDNGAARRVSRQAR
jgi:hypothetical protein